MATKTWLGDDPGNEGNWGVAANHDPAGVPVDGDDIILTGSQSVTAGFDQSAVRPGSFTVQGDYSGDIGDESHRLTFETSTATCVLYHAGTGKCYYALSFSSGAIVGTGTAGLLDLQQLKTTATQLQITKGRITVRSASAKAITGLFLGYEANQKTDVDLTLESALAITSAMLGGGVTKTLTNVTISTAYLAGGSLVHGAPSGSVGLQVYDGIFTQLQGASTPGNTIMFGGIVDLRGWYNGGTIANLVQMGGKLDLRNGGGNILITTFKRYGGQVLYEPGTHAAAA